VNTSRAYRDADSTVTLWVRDESGKLDWADADVIRMYFYAYGSATKVEESGVTPVFADAVTGRLTFTITSDYADTNLPRGSYRYSVVRNDAQVADGLLEVV
jgi:hypothetical protein